MHLVNYLKLVDNIHSLAEYKGDKPLYYAHREITNGRYIIIHNDYLPHIKKQFEVKYKA